MKKTKQTVRILKILFTILFVLGAFFIATNIQLFYTRDPMVCIALALFVFVLHLFAWVAPKTFFNLCWKMSALLPDYCDYDSGYRKLDVCGLSFVITSDLFLVMGLLIAIFRTI